jgi:hypothetical protein
MFYQVECGDGYTTQGDMVTGYRYNGDVGAGTWHSDTYYLAGYTSGYGSNKIYSCKTTHTASIDNQPGVGLNWETYWDLIGTISEYSASFYTGEGWHYYEYYMKHNTDDNFDGQFSVWVDGELKIDVIDMRNRNNANSLDWDVASLIDHVEIAAPSEYYIYIDDVTTSAEYIEYSVAGDTTPPSYPMGLSVE